MLHKIKTLSISNEIERIERGKTQPLTTGVRMSRVKTNDQAVTRKVRDTIVINTKKAKIMGEGRNTRATMVSLPGACHNCPCLAQTMLSLRACTTFDQTLFVYALV